jgi:hypothetical protein
VSFIYIVIEDDVLLTRHMSKYFSMLSNLVNILHSFTKKYSKRLKMKSDPKIKMYSCLSTHYTSCIVLLDIPWKLKGRKPRGATYMVLEHFQENSKNSPLIFLD